VTRECFICATEYTALGVEPTPDGVWFRGYGNYGSTLFDPMDGQYLDILVCDDCLRERAHRASCGRESKLVLCEGTVVGKARTPDRGEVPFVPGKMGHHDPDDVLNVEPEEVGTDLRTVEWLPGAEVAAKSILAKLVEKEKEEVSE
jgi:hypothetical protein